MKKVQKSRKPSFKGQDAGLGPIRMQKSIALGKQVPTGVTKRPGSKSSGGSFRIKTR